MANYKTTPYERMIMEAKYALESQIAPDMSEKELSIIKARIAAKFDIEEIDLD